MNTKADIKLIAMDMDGTLLNGEQQISKGNVEALKAAVQKGVHIAICSGRLSGDSSLFALDAGLFDCAILSLNGAYCLEKPNGKPYAEHTMAKDAVLRCLQVLAGYEITYGCFWRNQMVAIDGQPQAKKKKWGTHRNREGAPEYFSGREALEKAIPNGIAKIVYVEDADLSRLQEVRKQLEGIPGLAVTSSWSDNLELMPEGVCKGSAVRELAERLGFTAKNVMALGDYDNDLSMLTYADYGIAMGNASEAVKRASKYVTLSHQEDGVAHAIERFVL